MKTKLIEDSKKRAPVEREITTRFLNEINKNSRMRTFIDWLNSHQTDRELLYDSIVAVGLRKHAILKPDPIIAVANSLLLPTYGCHIDRLLDDDDEDPTLTIRRWTVAFGSYVNDARRAPLLFDCRLVSKYYYEPNDDLIAWLKTTDASNGVMILRKTEMIDYRGFGISKKTIRSWFSACRSIGPHGYDLFSSVIGRIVDDENSRFLNLREVDSSWFMDNADTPSTIASEDFIEDFIDLDRKNLVERIELIYDKVLNANYPRRQELPLYDDFIPFKDLIMFINMQNLMGKSRKALSQIADTLEVFDDDLISWLSDYRKAPSSTRLSIYLINRYVMKIVTSLSSSEDAIIRFKALSMIFYRLDFIPDIQLTTGHSVWNDIPGIVRFLESGQLELKAWSYGVSDFTDESNAIEVHLTDESRKLLESTMESVRRDWEARGLSLRKPNNTCHNG